MRSLATIIGLLAACLIGTQLALADFEFGISQDARYQLDAIKWVLPLLEARASCKPGELSTVDHVFNFDTREWESVYNYFAQWDQRKFEKVRDIIPRVWALGMAITASYPYMYSGNFNVDGGDPFAPIIQQWYDRYRREAVGDADNFELLRDKAVYEFVQASVCEWAPMTKDILDRAGKENDKMAKKDYKPLSGELSGLKMIESRAIYEGNAAVIILNKRLPVKRKYNTEEELQKIKNKFAEILQPVKDKVDCPPPPEEEGEERKALPAPKSKKFLSLPWKEDKKPALKHKPSVNTGRDIVPADFNWKESKPEAVNVPKPARETRQPSAGSGMELVPVEDYSEHRRASESEPHKGGMELVPVEEYSDYYEKNDIW